MKGLGQVVLQLDDIISSQGKEEGVDVCVRKNRERHDDLFEAFTVIRIYILRDRPKQPAPRESLGNCFVMWQMGVCWTPP